MSKEFEIGVKGIGNQTKITIKQVTGITGGIYGSTIDAVELTPFEAEKLVEELIKAAKAAKYLLNNMRYNIP